MGHTARWRILVIRSNSLNIIDIAFKIQAARKNKELHLDELLELEIIERNIRKELESYGNHETKQSEHGQESKGNMITGDKDMLYQKLIEELNLKQQVFTKKFDLYDMICNANEGIYWEIPETDSAMLKRAQTEMKYKKLIAQK